MFKLTIITLCVIMVNGDQFGPFGFEVNFNIHTQLLNITSATVQDTICMARVFEKCGSSSDDWIKSWNYRCCSEALRVKCIKNEAGSCQEAIKLVTRLTDEIGPQMCTGHGATWGDCNLVIGAIAAIVIGCSFVVAILGFVAFRLIQNRRQQIRLRS